MRKINQRQQAFVAEFLSNGGNATAAYRIAYSDTSGGSAAQKKAHKLKKHPLVAALLAEASERSQQVIAEAVNRYEISVERIVEAMARLAFTDMRQVCDFRTELDAAGKPREVLTVRDFDKIDPGAHQAIHEVKRNADGSLSIRLYNKREALMDLARIKGWIAEKAAPPQQLVMLKIER